MSDLVRCPACRGAKQVCKLGGTVGNCNTCKGKGEVKLSEKPLMVMAPIPEPVKEIVKAVSEAVAVSDNDAKEFGESQNKAVDAVMDIIQNHAKPISSKPNIYKRKVG